MWSKVFGVSFLLFTLVSNLSFASINDSLIGHWTFDEGSGSTAYDSANGLDGVIHGAQWTSGIQGGALDFDGENDHVSLPDNDPVWLPINDFTISFWILPERKPGTQETILDLDCGTSSISSNRLGCSVSRQSNTGKLCFRITTTKQDDELLLIDNPFVDTGIWYHVIAIREGTFQGLYINGTLMGFRACTPEPITYTGGYNDYKVSLGISVSPTSPTPHHFYKGAIDDLRIYDRSLSSSEIQTLAIDHGLVGHWAFDEGSGSTAYDSVNGLDGVVHGAQWVSGLVGGALDFDGVNDYVSLPDNEPVWLPENNFTVTFWVLYHNTPGTNIEDLLDLNSAGSSTASRNQGIGFQSSPTYGDHFLFSLVTTTQTKERLNSNQSLEKNKWYYVTAVRNGTSQELYINGQLDASRTCAAGEIDYSGGYDDDKVNIGAGSTNISESLRYFFDGSMDDLRIFDRALSSSEIQTLAIDHGLIGHWAFDEGSGSTAYDSVNGLDGVVHEAQWVSGMVGGALDFDGVNDYVSLPDNEPVWLPENNFTTSFWVFFNSPPGPDLEVLLDLNHAASATSSWNQGIIINTSPNYDNKILFKLTSSSTQTIELLEANQSLVEQHWYHVTAVRNGTSQELYINGQLDAIHTCPADSIDYSGGYDDNRVNIGAASTNISESPRFFFEGMMDDVRIYDRALSSGEIQTLATVEQSILDVSSTAGGSVTAPGEGGFSYPSNTSVSLMATPQTHYHFVNWTGSAVEAGMVANPSSAHTTVTMEDNFTLQANFAIDQYTLTLSTTEGGTITTPGVGSFS